MDQIQESIREVTSRVQATIADENKVIVIGPSGSGKSTLIHWLAGKTLVPHQSSTGLRLTPTDDLPGFNVGHDFRVGTKLPCSWHDRDRHVVFWDCPGFGDPRGPQTDIVNAFSIHELLKGRVKVLLVLPESILTENRATGFLNLLNQLASLFPENGQMEQALSVTFTKQRDTNPRTLLTELLQNSDNPGTLNDRAENFLRFLSENPDRVSCFPYPTVVEGPYALEFKEIWDSIRSATYVQDPIVTLQVGAEANLMIEAMSAVLNGDISQYIRTDLDKNISTYCHNQIQSHTESAQVLRTSFQTLARDIRGLQTIQPDSPTSLVSRLGQIFDADFDTNAMNVLITHLSFLKRIRNNVTHHTTDWTNALLPTASKIDDLTVLPESNYRDGMLSVRGKFLGTSDVETALASVRYPVTKVEVQSLSTIFIDQDIRRPGILLSFIAPAWKVVGTRQINLSGLPGTTGSNGASGVDGQPGTKGQNGGHFYGKGFVFDGMDLLTIQANGGNGGRGGNGGNGRNGMNGQDGDLSLVTRTEPYYDDYSPNGDYHEIVTGSVKFYESQGTNGTAGQNGGPAGHGGLGGYSGTVLIQGISRVYTAQNGTQGFHGNSGQAGRGGVHGRHCQGHVRIASMTDQYRCDGGKFTNHLGRRYDATFVAVSHQDPRGHAADGTVGSGLNRTGLQEATSLAPLNTAPLLQAYRTYYEQQQLVNDSRPFITPFPALQPVD